MEAVVIPAGDFWRDRRVLVTGHTGFKGAWLSEWLLAMGARVTGFSLAPDTEPSLFHELRLDSRLNSRIADLRDAPAIAAVVRDADPEIVLHLAAQALVRRSYADPVGTFATNVMGTVHLLEALRDRPALRAAVIVTSDKCYLNRETGQPYSEDDPLGGADPYSSSKAAAEIATAAWRRSFFPPGAAAIATARAGNVIGGGDWAADRLVPDCIRAFATGRPVEIRHPGAVRPWQHVLEPLAGYLRLAERLCAGPLDEAWNFGPAPEDAWPVARVVDRVAGSWGAARGWQPQPGTHPHEAAQLHLDSRRARDRLGWRPRLAIGDALDWTVDWYRRHRAGEPAQALTAAQIARYATLPELAA